MNDLRKLPTDRILVSPSVLACDFSRLGEEIARAEAAGADVIHLDVMDGHFVPNISFGPPVIRSVRKRSGMLFDTHLMISEPARYAQAFAEAGCDHLTFHLECPEPTGEVIDTIRKAGCTVGISLKPATPAEAVFPWLDRIDLVLVMTVEPGFGGQSFMAGQMAKCAAVKREILRRKLHVQLEADGGIDEKTVRTVAAALTTTADSNDPAGTFVPRHPSCRCGTASSCADSMDPPGPTDRSAIPCRHPGSSYGCPAGVPPFREQGELRFFDGESGSFESCTSASR